MRSAWPEIIETVSVGRRSGSLPSGKRAGRRPARLEGVIRKGLNALLTARTSSVEDDHQPAPALQDDGAEVTSGSSAACLLADTNDING